MADHYYRVSSNDGYTPQFLPVKEHTERQRISFQSNENSEYNACISFKELTDALSQCKDTAPGLDGIQYVVLRHLSDSACAFLLGIYNKVWLEQCFPDPWGEEVLLSFLKKEKPLMEPECYRPIALTSCVCKLMERVVNNRLQYILEKN